MYNKYFCDECKEVVGSHPVEHRESEHDGNRIVDVLRITEKTPDGDYIAQDDSMGHFTPHIWIESDGLERCGECGAIKISDDQI